VLDILHTRPDGSRIVPSLRLMACGVKLTNCIFLSLLYLLIVLTRWRCCQRACVGVSIFGFVVVVAVIGNPSYHLVVTLDDPYGSVRVAPLLPAALLIRLQASYRSCHRPVLVATATAYAAVSRVSCHFRVPLFEVRSGLTLLVPILVEQNHRAKQSALTG